MIVASTSAAAGTNPDTTGPLLAQWLNERGFALEAPLVVPDGEPVGRALRTAIAQEHAVVITTGGTGVSPSDETPEQTAGLLEVELPGIIEAIRRRGEGHTPLAVLTRGMAGFAGRTLIVNLPGSRGGVRDGMAVLDPLLDHLLDQRSGAGSHGPRV
ncbi:MogA/MoaB family molybdenum cofactor biosynthesis protein [Glutamicibacter endophyticus]